MNDKSYVNRRVTILRNTFFYYAGSQIYSFFVFFNFNEKI